MFWRSMRVWTAALGERAGGDVFVLARIAGHSSITGTQRYIHPQAEAINRVFSQVGTKLGTVEWGEPLRWHKFFGLSFRRPKEVLAPPSRRRGRGKGTAFESLSPAAL